MSKETTTATTTPPTPAPTPATPHTVCELQVDTQSPGWQKTVCKVLKGIQGVSFTIDASRGRARVSGEVNPNKLLLILAKAGKHAELIWVHHGNSQSNAQSYSHVYGNYIPTGYGGGYGYYNDYPYNDPYGGMNYYMDDPQQTYLYYQDYYPPQYYPPYAYHEPPAMYFPQGPPPVQNQRLQSVCNMM
uniref:HMA domain-containing protein n=1 Tax=Populus alba TaxID=43335 RepID=A0A4U5PTP7_POPAL|nr:hypothetical protein D5086_0000185540 [Populus alba]